MAQTEYYGFQDDKNFQSPLNPTEWNRLVNIVSRQLQGAYDLDRGGVIEVPDSNSLHVTANGTGVTIAAGRCVSAHSTKGYTYLRSKTAYNLNSGFTSATDQNFVFMVAVFAVLAGDPDSQEGTAASSAQFVVFDQDTLDGGILLAQATTDGDGNVTAVVDKRTWCPLDQARHEIALIEAAIGWPYTNARSIDARLDILEGGGLLAELFGNGRLVGIDTSAGAPIPTNAGVASTITLPSGGAWVIANHLVTLVSPVTIAGPDATAYGFLSLDGGGLPTVLTADWYTSFPTGSSLTALRAAGKVCLGRVDVSGTAPSQVVTAVDTYGHADLLYTQAGLLAIIDNQTAMGFTLAGSGRVVGADLLGVEPIPASPGAQSLTLPTGSVFVLGPPSRPQLMTLTAPQTLPLDYAYGRRYVFLSADAETDALSLQSFATFPTGGTLSDLQAAGAACLGLVTIASPGNGRVWDGADPTTLAPEPDPTFVYVRLQQGSEFVIAGTYVKLGSAIDINPPFDTGAKYGFLSLDGSNLPTILDADWFVDFPADATLAQLRADGKICVGLVSCLAGVVEGVNSNPGADPGGEADLTAAPVVTIVDAQETGRADLIYTNAGMVALLDRQIALSYLLAGMGRVVGTDTTVGQPTAQNFGINPSPPTAQWSAPGSAPTVTLPAGGQWVIGHRLIALAAPVVFPVPLDIMADGTTETHETHTRYGVLALGPDAVPQVTWLTTLSGRPANAPCIGKVTTQIDRVDTDPDPDLESWQTTSTYTFDATSATGGADFVYTTADLLALIAAATSDVASQIAAEDTTLRALIAARTDLLFEYAGNGRVVGDDPTVLAPVVSTGALRLRSGSHFVVQGSYVQLAGNIDIAAPAGTNTFYGFLSLDGGGLPTIAGGDWQTAPDFAALATAGQPCVGKATVVGGALTAFDATAATGSASLIYTQAGLLELMSTDIATAVADLDDGRVVLAFDLATVGRVVGDDATLLEPTGATSIVTLPAGGVYVIGVGDSARRVKLAADAHIAVTTLTAGDRYGFLTLDGGGLPTILDANWQATPDFAAMRAAGKPCLGKFTFSGTAITAVDATVATGHADLIYTEERFRSLLVELATAESDIAALQTTVALLQSQVASQVNNDLEWRRRAETTVSQAYDRAEDIDRVPSTVNVPGLLGNEETFPDGTTAQNNVVGGNWTRDDLGHQWK